MASKTLEIIWYSIWVFIYSIPSIMVSLYYCIASRPHKDVKGEIIMVTGSGQGLGRGMCLEFARLGAELICLDLVADKNQETVQLIREAGGKARGYSCDVSDRTAIIKLAQEVGRVDILVNNAGIYPNKGLWNATEQEIRTIMDVNLLSQFWTVQAFLPGMKERNHGHVVSISSVAGLGGFTYMEPYSATKAGIIGLMMTLEHELRTEDKFGVKLTTVYPYFFNTNKKVTVVNDSKLRIRRVELDEVTRETVNGILQELTSFTVPRELQSAFHFLNILPATYRTKWFNTFYPPMKRHNLQNLLKQN